MTVKCTYHKDGEPALVVLYPLEAAPLVPQSCYAFGAREHIEICRSINDLAQKAFDTCKQSSMEDVRAAFAAHGVVDELICAMGYEHTATEDI